MKICIRVFSSSSNVYVRSTISKIKWRILTNPKNSMNNRANIMYFIEHLCDMAQRENHLNFVRMMQKDILRVVDAVAPGDGSGAANVKVVRRVGSPEADMRIG